MIGHLTGTVILKQARSIILSTNGVGYAVFVTRAHLDNIKTDTSLALFVHTHVREDDITLYGFPSSAEWDFFKSLLTVSGVGPKSALELMNLPLTQLKTNIVKKNSVFLTQAPGIGKKTAERICIDLENKINKDAFTEDTGVAQDEIVEALISLGYPRHHVLTGLKKVPAEVTEAEAIIKFFLQNR